MTGIADFFTKQDGPSIISPPQPYGVPVEHAPPGFGMHGDKVSEKVANKRFTLMLEKLEEVDLVTFEEVTRKMTYTKKEIFIKAALALTSELKLKSNTQQLKSLSGASSMKLHHLRNYPSIFNVGNNSTETINTIRFTLPIHNTIVESENQRFGPIQPHAPGLPLKSQARKGIEIFDSSDDEAVDGAKARHSDHSEMEELIVDDGRAGASAGDPIAVDSSDRDEDAVPSHFASGRASGRRSRIIRIDDSDSDGNYSTKNNHVSDFESNQQEQVVGGVTSTSRGAPLPPPHPYASTPHRKVRPKDTREVSSRGIRAAPAGRKSSHTRGDDDDDDKMDAIDSSGPVGNDVSRSKHYLSSSDPISPSGKPVLKKAATRTLPDSAAAHNRYEQDLQMALQQSIKHSYIGHPPSKRSGINLDGGAGFDEFEQNLQMAVKLSLEDSRIGHPHPSKSSGINLNGGATAGMESEQKEAAVPKITEELLKKSRRQKRQEDREKKSGKGKGRQVETDDDHSSDPEFKAPNPIANRNDGDGICINSVSQDQSALGHHQRGLQLDTDDDRSGNILGGGNSSSRVDDDEGPVFQGSDEGVPGSNFFEDDLSISLTRLNRSNVSTSRSRNTSSTSITSADTSLASPFKAAPANDATGNSGAASDSDGSVQVSSGETTGTLSSPSKAKGKKQVSGQTSLVFSGGAVGIGATVSSKPKGKEKKQKSSSNSKGLDKVRNKHGSAQPPRPRPISTKVSRSSRSKGSKLAVAVLLLGPTVKRGDEINSEDNVHQSISEKNIQKLNRLSDYPLFEESLLEVFQTMGINFNSGDATKNKGWNMILFILGIAGEEISTFDDLKCLDSYSKPGKILTSIEKLNVAFQKESPTLVGKRGPLVILGPVPAFGQGIYRRAWLNPSYIPPQIVQVRYYQTVQGFYWFRQVRQMDFDASLNSNVRPPWYDSFKQFLMPEELPIQQLLAYFLSDDYRNFSKYGGLSKLEGFAKELRTMIGFPGTFQSNDSARRAIGIWLKKQFKKDDWHQIKKNSENCARDEKVKTAAENCDEKKKLLATYIW